MLELEDIKKMVDKDYQHNQTTRERAADDMVFYWITQWDEETLSGSDLRYKGEFNILRKGGRQIAADLRANPVQIDLHPKDDRREDAKELADGLYRAIDRENSSQEAYMNADGEAVVCGVGGWELYTKHETNREGDEHQVICRRPIYEANNTSFPDSNAKLLDKSDANRWTLFEAYSEDGYKELVHELTGEPIEEINPVNFKSPYTSFTFPWIDSKNDVIYVGKFYHRVMVKDKILTMTDPLGMTMLLRESDLEDQMDDLISNGYKIDEDKTKEIKRWQVTLYICSGEAILDYYTIPGENIPVVHTYGERAYVEGEEHYEGVTRLAKDPSRLRNFIMSYLGDIASRSPRQKPIFTAAMVKDFEFMYEENGADNNYPYYLMNSVDKNGNPISPPPITEMPDTPIPQAVTALAAETRQAVDDVASSGLPHDLTDTQLAHDTVQAIQSRLDQQSIVYQTHKKFAKRRDAEIWVSMAAEVYDAPRTVTISQPDGTTKKINVMEAALDKKTGEIKVLHDLTNMDWNVFATIGPEFVTRKEQTIEQLQKAMTETTDPAMQSLLFLKIMTLMDGVDMDDIKEYASNQLLIRGLRKPKTPEEEQIVMQAQQSQQPDSNTILAMAEDKKAQSMLMDSQVKATKAQNDMQNNDIQTQTKAFEAETNRIDSQVNAHKVGAEIQYGRVDAFAKAMEHDIKNQALRARVSAP